MSKQTKNKLLSLSLLIAFTLSSFGFSLTAKADEASDSEYYEKYELYKKYEKKELYDEYTKYKKYKDKYKDCKASKSYKLGIKKCSSAKKKYDKYKKYSKYSKYKSYDKDEYDNYRNYGTSEYADGHARYLSSQENGGLGEATLGGGTLGPEISVGLYNYTKSELRDDTYVRVRASKDYYVKDEEGTIVATVPANIDTEDDDIGVRVKYVSDGDLKVYQSVTETTVGSDAYFEAQDGDNSTIIFDLNYPSSSYDQYRGKIKVHFYDSSDADGDRIWIINTLPLEHYVWGIGEITGTGDSDYNRAMTVMFRTYGYWKIRWSTQYAAQGFTVVNTSSNQIYSGYDHELAYPNIRTAAEETRGKIMMYGGEIALSPYSSWTDGNARSFEERWGSTAYPWCKSVADPYGKHATLSTEELVAAGNHMVGLSAHGALNLATDYSWDWDEILNYYFYGTRIMAAY